MASTVCRRMVARSAPLAITAMTAEVSITSSILEAHNCTSRRSKSHCDKQVQRRRHCDAGRASRRMRARRQRPAWRPSDVAEVFTAGESEGRGSDGLDGGEDTGDLLVESADGAQHEELGEWIWFATSDRPGMTALEGASPIPPVTQVRRFGGGVVL